MMNMKNIRLKSALALVMGLSMTSCADFLDITPLNLITEDNYWDEQADVEQALFGIYTRMQDGDFLKRCFVWGELRSDNVTANTDQLKMHFDEYKILIEDLRSTNVYTSWEAFYSVINRCNQVIERAPQVAEKDPSFTTTEVQAIVAEATALRGLCYFYLVRAFKDVPYYTYGYTADEQPRDLAQSSGSWILDEVINQLVQVRDNALRAFPNVDGEDKSYGRMTRYAITALLADICMWQGRWTEAAAYADEVIERKKTECAGTLYNVDGYPLLPDNNGLSSGQAYQALFGEGGSLESIFELDFDLEPSTKSNSMVSDFFFENISGDKHGVKIFYPTKSLYTVLGSAENNNLPTRLTFINKDDARIFWTTVPDDIQSPQKVENVMKYVAYSYVVSEGSRVLGWIPRPSSDTNDANFIFYRTSDMMLIRAEALLRQIPDNLSKSDIQTALNEARTEGDEGKVEEYTNYLSYVEEAEELVTAVSNRAYTGGSQSTPLKFEDTWTKDILINLLFTERRLEFAFEGKRWFDLVRKARFDGNSATLISALAEAQKGITVSTSKLGVLDALYFPVNYYELQRNPLLKQNPAYPEGTDDSYESTANN